MRRENIDGSANGAVAPVGGEDDDGSDTRLQRAVKVCETLRRQRFQPSYNKRIFGNNHLGVLGSCYTMINDN